MVPCRAVFTDAEERGRGRGAFEKAVRVLTRRAVHTGVRSHKQAVSAAAKARIHSAHAGSSIDTNLNEPMGLAHGHSAVTPAGGWAQQRRGQG